MAKKKAKVKAKKKATKVSKPRTPRGGFGLDARITSMPAENWRREGTGNHTRVAELMAFMKKKPVATVHEALSNTTYRKQDYLWDLERKVFKTAKVAVPKTPKTPKAVKAKAKGSRASKANGAAEGAAAD